MQEQKVQTNKNKIVKRCCQQPKTKTRCTSLFSWSPTSSTSQGQALLPRRFRTIIERQPAVHIDGWFATAARIFQRAKGCAVLLFDTAIGRVKETVPAVLLSLWLSAHFTPSAQLLVCVLTPSLATYIRQDQALLPRHFRRNMERQLAVHVNVWFVTVLRVPGYISTRRRLCSIAV